MSFLQRAREAAEAAAEGAQHATEAARTKASEVGQRASDPAVHERLSRKARDAVGQARKGMATVVEKIDPSTLAELIIKATALQEKTNAALRDKKSPYRIGEIAISASIPPGVSFVISRIDEGEILSGTAVTSAELIDTLPEVGETVIALDGTIGDVSVDEAPST
ncbi:MAG: hypothetical protein WEE50_05855 [Chloroflexota bacterium]